MPPTPPWSPLPIAWRRRAFQEPAILLESSTPSESEHYSYLFTDPLQLLIAETPQELPSLFAAIEAALAQGRHVAGWFAYEAGAHFLNIAMHNTRPVAVLGVFTQPMIFDHRAQHPSELKETQGPLDLAAMPALSYDAYRGAIAEIQARIAAGDTYQLNYTMQMRSPCTEASANIYDALQQQQPCSYEAVINLQAGSVILSLSPELFFRTTADGVITTRPMKGTAPRGATPVEDAAIAQALRADEKNRAEHVMIVDLLRNDLGRICQHGSVTTPQLFHVERYETLHQMTSTIRGHLNPAVHWYDVFRALFPCGSITGAPKRNTAQLITQLEQQPRGPYTGAIGYFAPDRSACFNVAIRTVVLQDRQLTLGVGGGIVADSTPGAEYDECVLKAAFLQRASKPLHLIETMRWQGGLPLLEQHLARLQRSCQALGFPCDAALIENQLCALTADWEGEPRRVRLLHSREGITLLQVQQFNHWTPELNIVMASRPSEADAPHLQHKTTFRPAYDPAFRAAQNTGYHEAIFLNERGELAEGCISNLLVKSKGGWLTPPLHSGVLAGVYRATLLQRGLIHEQTLTLADLRNAQAFCLCNAVRGVGTVIRLTLPSGETLHWQPAPDAQNLNAW